MYFDTVNDTRGLAEKADQSVQTWNNNIEEVTLLFPSYLPVL
jgi:hypothetical protein